MTGDQILEVLLKYEMRLREKIYGSEAFPTQNKHPSKYQALRHVLWMIAQMKTMNENQYEQIQRWLGFIQGVLWANGLYAIQELRDHNRDRNK